MFSLFHLCTSHVLHPFMQHRLQTLRSTLLHNVTPHAVETPTSCLFPSCLLMLVGILKWVEFRTKHSSWTCLIMPTCGERSREARVSDIKQEYATGNRPEGNIFLACPPVDAHGETMPVCVCVCVLAARMRGLGFISTSNWWVVQVQFYVRCL